MRRSVRDTGRGTAWWTSTGLLSGVALLGACTQIESRDLIREGNLLYQDAKFEQAVERYSASIELEPDGIKVFYNRGCAAMAEVLKLKNTEDPAELARRKNFTDIALGDFQTWLDRAGAGASSTELADASADASADSADSAAEAPAGGVDGSDSGAEDARTKKRSNAELVRDYRLTLLDADARCDDLLQYWMDKHKAEPQEESWYAVIGRQYDACGKPEKRVEWMHKRAQDFPNSVKAWYLLAMDAYEPLYAEPGSPTPYNENLTASERLRTANKVIELLDKATAIDPQFLGAYNGRSMAYTQRMFARVVVKEPELPEEQLEAILAREDSMLAWKNQKALCDLEDTPSCSAGTVQAGQACCPEPPLGPQAQAEDAARKVAIEAEIAAKQAAVVEQAARKAKSKKRSGK